MRSLKQVVVAIAAGGVLVVGGTVAGIVLTQGTSLADNVDACLANLGSGSECHLTDQSVPDPSSIYLQFTSPAGASGLQASVSWSVSCPSTATPVTGSQVTGVPSDLNLLTGIDISSAESCLVTANLQVVNFKTLSQNAEMALDYNEGTGTGAGPSPTPTATATSSAPSGGISGAIKGFDGKCVNDPGNSSALRAVVDSYACSGAKGKTWRYVQGMLVHNNLCLNDKGNAGNGGKLILYTCNGGPDEIWIFNSLKNIYQLKAHNFGLCLTIPGSSTKNGVQLQADTCHGSAGQHWALP
jgi:hypothetical protein